MGNTEILELSKGDLVAQWIKDDIVSQSHPAVNGSEMFICDHELREVWEDWDLIDIFPLLSWSSEERRQIRSQYLKVLSTLICINWMSPSNFRALFFLRSINDSCLPLRQDQLRSLGLYRDSFQQMQYAFIPVIIKEFDEPRVQLVRSDERLPFIRHPSNITNNGYGVISEVTIPPRYLCHEGSGTEKENAKVVACKKYMIDRNEGKFRAKLKNLNYLKNDLGGQGKKRIMIHTAAILQEHYFMVLLPLAELLTLEVFLLCGFEYQYHAMKIIQVRVYDFDKEFPGLTPSVLQDALFNELVQIASALVWLHDEIRVLGSEENYCAHMNLEPKSILVKRDHASRVGKWMISDFGISIFDKGSNQMDLRVQSIRDVGERLTSSAHEDGVPRDIGPYQPPEANSPNVDVRKCNVWAFGCIVCEVLKFCLQGSAIDGKRELESFREARSSHFFKGLQGGQRGWNTSDNGLDGAVNYWLDSLSLNPPNSWVKDCVTMLRKVIVIDPESRLKTEAFMEALDSLSSIISSEIRLNIIPKKAPPATQIIPPEVFEYSPNTKAGIVGHFFGICVHMFWDLIKEACCSGELDSKDISTLQGEFERFYFWGEGFHPKEGGLDEILHSSTSLREQTVSLLIEVGKILCSRKTGLYRILGSTTASDAHTRLNNQLLYLMDKLKIGSSDDQIEDADSIFSEDTDLEFSIEAALDDLQTYVGCLTKLRLSLERPAPDTADAETTAAPATISKVLRSRDVQSGADRKIEEVGSENSAGKSGDRIEGLKEGTEDLGDGDRSKSALHLGHEKLNRGARDLSRRGRRTSIGKWASATSISLKKKREHTDPFSNLNITASPNQFPRITVSSFHRGEIEIMRDYFTTMKLSVTETPEALLPSWKICRIGILRRLDDSVRVVTRVGATDSLSVFAGPDEIVPIDIHVPIIRLRSTGLDYRFYEFTDLFMFQLALRGGKLVGDDIAVRSVCFKRDRGDYSEINYKARVQLWREQTPFHVNRIVIFFEKIMVTLLVTDLIKVGTSAGTAIRIKAKNRSFNSPSFVRARFLGPNTGRILLDKEDWNWGKGWRPEKEEPFETFKWIKIDFHNKGDMRGFLDSFRELMKPFQRPIPTISFPENALLDTYIQTHDYNITHSNEYDEAQRLVEEREKQGDLYLYLPPNLLKSVILRPTNAPAKGSQEQPG